MVARLSPSAGMGEGEKRAFTSRVGARPSGRACAASGLGGACAETPSGGDATSASRAAAPAAGSPSTATWKRTSLELDPGAGRTR